MRAALGEVGERARRIEAEDIPIAFAIAHEGEWPTRHTERDRGFRTQETPGNQSGKPADEYENESGDRISAAGADFGRHTVQYKRALGAGVERRPRMA